MVEWDKVIVGGAIVAIGLSPAIPALDDIPALLIGGPLLFEGLFGEREAERAREILEAETKR